MNFSRKYAWKKISEQKYALICTNNAQNTIFEWILVYEKIRQKFLKVNVQKYQQSFNKKIYLWSKINVRKNIFILF